MPMCRPRLSPATGERHAALPVLFPIAVMPPSSPWTYCVLSLVVVVEPSEVVANAVAREPLPLPSGSLSAAASSAPRLCRHA
ncbi:hypothetical protein E2562_034421 [Oryza meyeriana var. granulata]|uniref:Uncharacterized protein n=1 Tax=Oryza meyeriana var. granulata TaxID=110450 RepID=A0A6G1BNL5_9ORYZ|nr:hypothetical protein E2562_034421 [Oryza meyeriana var. granulata]